MSAAKPRFGVWAIVGGAWGPAHDPEEPADASWERNRALIVEAEQLGYDSTLVAQHTVNPRGPEHDELEAWTASAALAAVTERIEIITAIKPYLCHPVVLAKQALQIEEISKGRAAINLVNAWYKPELDQAGIGFAEHDERYEYGREWITIVRELISGRRTSFRGRWFHVDGYELSPKDGFRQRPTIYLGGESEPARSLAVDVADVWFINGQPPAVVDGLMADLRRRKRAGVPLRFGLSAFVIARETTEEAEQALAHLWGIDALERTESDRVEANIDPKAVMFQTSRKFPAIGTNGGTAAGLVGSYDEVAERVHAFNDLGIELFMLQFQPFEREMRRFAQEIIPRVRSLTSVAT